MTPSAHSMNTLRPSLHADVSEREGSARPRTRAGSRRHHQPGQHQREQHQPHGRPLGSSQLVIHAVSIQDPPHPHHQHAGLQHPQRREMLEQAVRELGDGEDEHQIEEQLDEVTRRARARAAL